jgi:hypothetical protein
MGVHPRDGEAVRTLTPSIRAALIAAIETAAEQDCVSLTDTVGQTFHVLELMRGNLKAGNAVAEAWRAFPGTTEYLLALVRPGGELGPGEMWMFTTPARPKMLITAVVLPRAA